MLIAVCSKKPLIVKGEYTPIEDSKIILSHNLIDCADFIEQNKKQYPYADIFHNNTADDDCLF